MSKTKGREIPRKFYIKDKLWTVSYERGAEQDGLTVQETREIIIRRELAKDAKWETFLHEFFHASLFELHLSGPSDVLASDLEEIICTGLADILSSTFSEMKFKERK